MSGTSVLSQTVLALPLLSCCLHIRTHTTAGLDLSFLTTYAGASGKSSVRLAQAVHSNGSVLDDEILADKDVREAIRTQGSVTKAYNIVNVDRSALGRVAGAVAKPYGDSGGAFVCVWGGKGAAGRTGEMPSCGCGLVCRGCCQPSCRCSGMCRFRLALSVSDSGIPRHLHTPEQWSQVGSRSSVLPTNRCPLVVDTAPFFVGCSDLC